MPTSLLRLVFYGCLCLGNCVIAHNILVMSPITTHSHSNILRSLVKALAQRGNHVTYWNGIKPDPLFFNEALMNNSSIKLLHSFALDHLNTNHQIGIGDRDSPFRLLFEIPAKMDEFCTLIFQDPIFHQLFDSNFTSTKPYDLVIMDGVFNECTLPIVHKLDVPFIYVSCLTPPPWLLMAIGSPLGFDSYPNTGIFLTDHMNFWQRTFNTLVGMLAVYFRHWFVMPIIDRRAQSMIVDYNTTMSMEEIEDKYFSLLITNTHFSINYQQPTSAAVINAGGLHCCPPSNKPLDKELKSFVDGSGDDGFIIVSFGSIIKGANITDDIRRIFMTTFARLPQRVVWKWENRSHFNDPIPANVKLLSWLPQQDLLAHPKIRLFITHGGLLSNQEAVFYSVPFIAMPVFADQPANAQKAHDDGYAIRLHWNDLTEETLYNSIHQILHNPKYAKKMKQVSSVMHDQIDQPLDRAVYWIEYVIRHNGAPHLRSPSRRLGFFQRSLVDVMVLLFSLISILVYAVYRLMARCRVQHRAKRAAVDSCKKLN